MKGKAVSAILVILALALLPTMSLSVARSKPVTVSGTLADFTTTIVWSKTTGDVTIMYVTETGQFWGDISGAFRTNEVFYVVGWDPNSFSWKDLKFLTVVTFDSATVLGKTGGLTLLFIGDFASDYSAKATVTILSGTGGLAGLHGQGIAWWLTGGYPTYYQLQLYFG